MLFKIDENLPSQSVLLLRNAGHDALSVLDQQMGGHPDSDIAEICRAEFRILLTLDTDFANIIAYPPSAYSGLVILRLADQSKESVLSAVRKFIAALEKESPNKKLWIVENDRIRVRE